MSQISIRLSLLIFLASTLLMGCGKKDSGPARYRVSGTINFKGQPLSHGTIQFIDSGKGSGGGATIKDGVYEIPEEKGLSEGKYKVLISSGDKNETEGEAAPGESGPPAKELIPAEYNSESKHTVEVTPGGANEFNFDIK